MMDELIGRFSGPEPAVFYDRHVCLPGNSNDMTLSYGQARIQLQRCVDLDDMYRSYLRRTDLQRFIPPEQIFSDMKRFYTDVKTRYFQHFYPYRQIHRSSASQMSAMIDQAVWPLPDGMLWNGKWHALSESASDLILSTDDKTFSFTRGIDQSEMATDLFRETRALFEDLHSATTAFGNTSYGNHSILCLKDSIAIPVPRHAYSYADALYVFPATNVGMDIRWSGNQVRFSEPSICSAAHYHHPFVFASNNICFNGNDRWHRLGIHFEVPQDISQDSVRQCVEALLQARRTIMHGWIGSPVPVNYFEQLTDFRETDARGAPVHVCT